MGPRLGQESFLSNVLQFIIHLTPYNFQIVVKQSILTASQELYLYANPRCFGGIMKAITQKNDKGKELHAKF
jgi:hypothetical protein